MLSAENVSVESQQDLEAASVLLSLHDDVRDDTQDELDDNSLLMPIRGSGAPVDVALQEIKLDQPNIDAAIADLVQSELNQEQSVRDPALSEALLPTEQTAQLPADTEIEKSTQQVDEEETGGKKKGSLHMKGYGLKRKQTTNCTFKCGICESVKSSVQKLNAHHRRHHAPQMCGICGRIFTLSASLTRHMYDHRTLDYKCEHCPEAFHFESELKTHKIKH